MTLIQDPFNGQRWQWKYLQRRRGYVTGWFDYGPDFDTRAQAIRWMDARDA